MRYFVSGYLLVIGMFLWPGCSPSGVYQPKPQPSSPAQPVASGFPTGWEQWNKFNESTVFRSDPSEARELHYNSRAKGFASGQFPVGVILVKAQYESNSGRRGALQKLNVMHKVASSTGSEWKFTVYDAATRMKAPVDADSCVICHSQRSPQDFVFSNRNNL